LRFSASILALSAGPTRELRSASLRISASTDSRSRTASPASQVPSAVRKMGAVSTRSCNLSRTAYTLLAAITETSRSTERLPKISPIRVTALLMAVPGRYQAGDFHTEGYRPAGRCPSNSLLPHRYVGPPAHDCQGSHPREALRVAAASASAPQAPRSRRPSRQ